MNTTTKEGTPPRKAKAGPPLPRRRAFDYADPFAVFKGALPMEAIVGTGVLMGALLPREVCLAVSALSLAPTLYRAVSNRLGRNTDPLTARVVPGRKTAHLKGDFVVFHIGGRANVGIDGNFKWMGDAMEAMQKELEENSEELGCLGTENYMGTHGQGTLSVQYWKSLDHLNAYARSSAGKHTGAWAKLMKMGRNGADYGFWHEAFQVRNGEYDTIYVNCPPLLLGNAKGAKLGQCKGRMKSAAGRAGKTDGSDYAKEFGTPDY
jgi:hypothetical protein